MNRLAFFRSLLVAPFAAKAVLSAPSVKPTPEKFVYQVDTYREVKTVGTHLGIAAAAGDIIAVRMFDGTNRWQLALKPILAGQRLTREDVTCEGYTTKGNYDLETSKPVT